MPDFATLARQPRIKLPTPPAWVAVPGSALCDIGEATAEIKKVTTKIPQINYVRSTFVKPAHSWLLAYVAWFRKLDKPLNLHYEDQLFDCDKFARCFVAFADLLAQKGGETRGSIAIGWATVYNDYEFGGVPEGTAHAVVIIWTDEGVFIVEPQGGTISALSDYPNRNAMSAVYL
jgi:hypothetical protein